MMIRYMMFLLLLPSIASATCNSLWSIPYVTGDHPRERMVAINKWNEELKELGMIYWQEIEAPGNRAIVCLISGDGIKQTEFRDVLHSIGGSRLASYNHAKIIMDAPLYPPMFDEELGQIVFADGKDGRPLRLLNNKPELVDWLRKKGEDFREQYMIECYERDRQSNFEWEQICNSVHKIKHSKRPFFK